MERLTPFHDTAQLDAEVLLAFILGKSRAHLHTWPERELDSAAWRRFQDLVERRSSGEPVAYLTGQREFWSLNLKVTRDTLIPRPETELLVELALAALPADRPGRVADIGTGTGAIALAIARERPQCTVVATDVSGPALEVARGNAERLGIHNVKFRLGELCEPLCGEAFDMIVSNPPYVAAADPHLMQGDVRFEPTGALVAGPDGLDVIRRLVLCARELLAPGGLLLLEHGYDQAAAVQEVLTRHGYHDIVSHRDTAGCSRAASARR